MHSHAHSDTFIHLLLHVLTSSHSTCTHMHTYVHALTCSHPKVTYTPINLHYHRLKHTHTHTPRVRERERCSCIYKHTLHHLSHIIIYLRPPIASYIDISTHSHMVIHGHTQYCLTQSLSCIHTQTHKDTHLHSYLIQIYRLYTHTLIHHHTDTNKLTLDSCLEKTLFTGITYNRSYNSPSLGFHFSQSLPSHTWAPHHNFSSSFSASCSLWFMSTSPCDPCSGPLYLLSLQCLPSAG